MYLHMVEMLLFLFLDQKQGQHYTVIFIVHKVTLSIDEKNKYMKGRILKK